MPQLILGTCSLGVFFMVNDRKKGHVCTECSNLSLVRDELILSFLPFRASESELDDLTAMQNSPCF